MYMYMKSSWRGCLITLAQELLLPLSLAGLSRWCVLAVAASYSLIKGITDSYAAGVQRTEESLPYLVLHFRRLLK